jgi:hypothetical protein
MERFDSILNRCQNVSMGSIQAKVINHAAEPSVRAALHLMAEIERAHHERLAADTRVRKFGEALSLMLESLPQPERLEIQHRLDRVRSNAHTSGRSGEMHDNVVALFKHHSKREWSIPEIQAELTKDGGPVDSKALYNAVNYLAKTGRLRRVSRGQYLVLGIGAGLDVDGIAEDGTSRASEHD